MDSLLPHNNVSVISVIISISNEMSKLQQSIVSCMNLFNMSAAILYTVKCFSHLINNR